ncbi:MAG: transglycosylase SLT domain-containing protein [Rhodobacterales bacterium]|nr:transglycosylase SLT domain-containing protein [Rhodobacterales bacterium]
MPHPSVHPCAVLQKLIRGALALAAATTLAHSGDDPSALCLQAARAAADRTGVPYEVLLAVSLVETGRDRRPWPWTVNLGGEGHWLDSAPEAEALVAAALDQGATNIDIGCFQLNYRWHAEAFSSVADMLDPGQNASYAAEYLASHFATTGDWALAAAAYHSATPEHADRYRTQFETTFAGLTDGELPPGSEIAETRVNTFPLLVVGAAGTRGSLVPATSGGRRLIGGP